MEQSTYTKSDILFIQLKGDLIGESNGLAIMELISEKGNAALSKCAIDLSEVRYMNSSGIGVLITLLTKFRNKGGEMLLINPSEQIKKLLIITKLTSVFSIVADEAEAISKLS
jgi:anti-sigma B factor antagonist